MNLWWGIAQKTRLTLISKIPSQYGFDLYELGHAWWLPAELSDEELRKSERHRDMGNPITSRIPKRLEEYRFKGTQYIVTNFEAQSRYKFKDGIPPAFPSFVRFYSSLKQIKPIKTFKPFLVGGKGSDIFIYDIINDDTFEYATR